MFIKGDTEVLSARKDAQTFHRNHNIKLINGVVVYTTDWDTLKNAPRCS